MAAVAHQLLTISQVSVRSAPRQGGLMARLGATLRLWQLRNRERAALAQLSQRDLADFGASTADVYRELSTPFWREMPPY